MFSRERSTSQSIFVSSTFRDMHAERDALRDYVLPRVNEFAGRYGRLVELVDLRWGIDTAGIDEEEQNKKVLNTCLEEIDRSHPFFIGMLGDRYGWVVPQSTLDGALAARQAAIDRTEKAVTELEIEYGALCAKGKPLCLFYFRNLAHAGMGLPAVYGDDPAGTQKLNTLKKRIREKYGAGVKEYTARLENGEVASLQQFCDMLTEDIIFALEKEWGPAADAEKSRGQRENEAQAAFYAYHMESFAGRREYLDRLSDQILAATGQGVTVQVLTGAAGSGKSALLSALAEEIENRGCLALLFYCGITGRSSTLEDMLLYYINGLNAFLGYGEESGGGLGFTERRELLAGLLAEACKKTRVVMLGDGIDTLRPSRLLDESLWLEELLPPAGAAVVLTCAPGYTGLASLRRLGAGAEQMEALVPGDVARVLESQAASLHKELSPAVAAHICAKKDEEGRSAAENPLYLRLLVQVMAMLDRHGHARIEAYSAKGMPAIDAIAKVMKEVVDEIPPRPEAAYVAVFKRLEEIVGRAFVQMVLAMIAASRFGVREDVLGEAFAELDLAYGTADFAWLRQLLGKQLTQGEYGQWNFMHQCMRRAVRLYLPGTVAKANQALVPVLRKRLTLYRYAAEEILHHLYKARLPALAAEILSGDIPYYETEELPPNTFSILASRPQGIGLSMQGYSPQFVGIITAEDNAPAYADALADIFTDGDEGKRFVLDIPRHGGEVDATYACMLANLYYAELMDALPGDAGPAQRLALLEAVLSLLRDKLDTEMMNRRLYIEIGAKAAEYSRMLGDEARAMRYLRQNLDESRLLYAESGDIDDEWHITTVQNRWGDYYVDQGDYKEALALYRQALTTRQVIAEIEPERDLSASYLRVGEVLGKLGEEDALVFLHKAFEARRARAEELGSGESLGAFGTAASYLADYHEEKGEAPRAFEYAQAAQRAFRHAYQAGGEIRFLRDAATALLSMARAAVGELLAEEISGYHARAIEDYSYILDRQASVSAAQELGFAQMQACLYHMDSADDVRGGVPKAHRESAAQMLESFFALLDRFGYEAADLSTLRAAAAVTRGLAETGALAKEAACLKKARELLEYVYAQTGGSDIADEIGWMERRQKDE